MLKFFSMVGGPWWPLSESHWVGQKRSTFWVKICIFWYGVKFLTLSCQKNYFYFNILFETREKNLRFIRDIFLKLSANNLSKWALKWGHLGHICWILGVSAKHKIPDFWAMGYPQTMIFFPKVEKYLYAAWDHRKFLVSVMYLAHYLNMYLQRPVFQRCAFFEKVTKFAIGEPPQTPHHRKFFCDCISPTFWCV